MLLKQAIFAVTASAAALQAERSLKSRTTADSYNTINYDDFESGLGNGTTLEKRIDWAWCFKDGNKAKCAVTAATIANVCVAIAQATYAKSKNHDCSYSSGTVDDVQYQIHATGSNCDTTAEEKTIEGGLMTYFDSQGGTVCDVHCVHQTHGGTYNGYLLIAPTGVDISSVKCDESVQFPQNQCGAGGKNDAP